MAGHSKWANTKHRKAAQDLKRNVHFAKLCREIAVAVRVGGGTADKTNSVLQMTLLRAKAGNLPKDRIADAISRGLGSNTDNMAEAYFEGYGPGGSAVVIKCLTDNKNRTTQQIRFIFKCAEANLGSTGAVSWMFPEKGRLVFHTEKADTDRLLEKAMECNSEEVDYWDWEAPPGEECSGESFAGQDEVEIVCEKRELMSIRDTLEAAGFVASIVEVMRRPNATVSLPSDSEALQAFDEFLDKLEDSDDVMQVFHNVVLCDDENDKQQAL